jgi:hypothetical protein
MKKLLIYFAMSVAILGCADTYEFIPNNAPVLKVNGNDHATIVDSVKISLKYGNNPYDLSVFVQDLEKQKVKLSGHVSSLGVLEDRDGNVVDGELPLEGSTVQLWFVGNDVGNTTVHFTATDELGKSRSVSLNLFVFLNLPPVADFTYANTKTAGPYYMEYDASKSYDADKTFHGEIQLYRYTVTGTVGGQDYIEVIDSKIPFVKHNLPGVGGYDILLEVFDNDGAKASKTQHVNL